MPRELQKIAPNDIGITPQEEAALRKLYYDSLMLTEQTLYEELQRATDPLLRMKLALEMRKTNATILKFVVPPREVVTEAKDHDVTKFTINFIPLQGESDGKRLAVSIRGELKTNAQLPSVESSCRECSSDGGDGEECDNGVGGEEGGQDIPGEL